MLIALFKWTLRVRVFVFLINSHQKASTTDGAVNNQEDRITTSGSDLEQLYFVIVYPRAGIIDSQKTQW